MTGWQTSAAYEPTIKVQWPRPGTVLVILGGEHDLSSAASLTEIFDQSLNACDHLIVDISTAAFIDSTTIHAIVNAKSRADERGRMFNLVMGTAPIVERALEISGVLPGLNVVETVDRALAA